MIQSQRRLGSACLAAALVASPAAAQRYSVPCGCDFYAPAPRYEDSGLRLIYNYQPHIPSSAVVQRSSARAQTNLYYSADEAQALYHPVVIPLDELLNPGKPIALTPDELARQRAAAEARTAPPLPPQGATPPAGTADADPFQDDAAATAEPPAATDAPPAPADTAVEEPAELAEEEMTAEEPAAESEPMPEAEAPPPEVDAEVDPFNIPE